MHKLEKPKENFTIVCNELLRDKRLSLRAKGLYALMFSKPHDWVFYEGALVEESAEGRDAVRAAMRELADAGWLSKHQPRENGGLLAQTVIRLHITVDWKSGDGSTGDGKSTTTKTNQTKTEEVSPSVSPTTKATKRATLPVRRLEEFLELTDGAAPPEFGDYASKLGWDCERAGRVWTKFERYWRSPDAVIGSVLGRTGVIEKPRTAVEAEAMAVALTTTSLPPSVQAWLTATVHHSLVASSVGGHAPALPVLTEEERQSVCQSVQSLSEILRPAGERGVELEIVIGKLFAGFNVYTGDEGKVRAQIAVWCEELEEFPLFAVRKAARWAVRGCQRLPSLAAFIADTRLAIGSGVLERRKLLIKALET